MVLAFDNEFRDGSRFDANSREIPAVSFGARSRRRAPMEQHRVGWYAATIFVVRDGSGRLCRADRTFGRNEHRASSPAPPEMLRRVARQRAQLGCAPR